MIKYLGSKRLLLPRIVEEIRALKPRRPVLDLFSGTARVAHALKAAGLAVIANDHNEYAWRLAHGLVVADRERWQEPAARLVAKLNEAAELAHPAGGWFTETYARRARFFQPANAARIEAARRHLASLALDPELASVAMASLLAAADRVDSTTGVQMAYLKEWAPRSERTFRLEVPELLPRARAGAAEAWRLDALEAARRFTGDVAYLDPPYNQHSYLGNYHVGETLALGDEPEVFGVACKRVDVRTRRSRFNSRRATHAALAEVLEALDGVALVLSFNDEGFISREAVEALLARHGTVRVEAIPFRRYVGARIGLHNPRGERVGTISHLENREFLFTVIPARRRNA